MAGTRVDPPPLNVAVVDGRGFPTSALRDFLHRLWIRTGGSDDELNTVLRLMTSGAYPSSNEGEIQASEQEVMQFNLSGSGVGALGEELGSLQALVQAMPRGEPPADLSPVVALMQAEAQRHASEIATLREEVDALRHAQGQRSSNAESAQATEDANAAQVLLFTNAMPQGTPY